MEGKNSKNTNSPFKATPDGTQENNKNVPRGLLFREFGHKQRLGVVSQEFQAIAEEKLVMKTHDELRCELPGSSRSTYLIVFSPDGSKVASTHGNHNVYVTDLTTGKNVNTLSGHPRTPWCIAFHPSSNQILASACLGGQVRVWDLHGGSEIWMSDGQTVISSLAFHPTDRMLLICTYNELHFWDWSQPEPFTKCCTNNEKEKVRYVAFDSLGHKLITGITNASQIQSQWDRVPLCNQGNSSQHRSSLLAPDRERRITVCYRSLVEQYEQLVQRYFDLSRSRSISTMDRGTDPMDFDSEASTNVRTRTTSGPSTSSGDNGPSTNNSGRRQEQNSNSASEEGTSNTNSSSNTSNTPGYLHSLFPTQWQRNRSERPVSRTDSATATSETEQGSGTNSGSSTPGYQRRNDSRWYLPPLYHINPRSRFISERTSNTTHTDTLRRRLNMFLDSGVSHTTPSHNRDILIVREDNHLRNHGNSSYEPDSERTSNRNRPSSPVFLPSVPRRFFVSQSSAFQPRGPRLDHSSEARNSSRAVPPRRSTQRISLNAATAAAVAAVPERRDLPHPPPVPPPPTPVPATRPRSDMTDLGVRYGIQLLSRHIDNMQRLCRARLEILQLQQIRRMWEDLQHQIRSLHSAVRESSITLARLAESPSPGPSHVYSGSQTPSNDTSQIPVSSEDAVENSSDGNSGHIPSVSQMLELARISDNSPSGSRDISSQNSTEDNLSRVPEEEIFQSPDGSSRSEADPSGSNSLSDPSLSSGSTVNDDTNNQQYSFRCQMLQQRLWRISRKVYLRRPRLLTVNSRSMRRQLYSSHPPLNRGNSSQSRHTETGRRAWFLLPEARHRSVTKSTSNVSSQVDSSCPPGKPDERKDLPLSSSSRANINNSTEIDSQPGPSGLCSKTSNSRKLWNEEKAKVPVLDEDDDDDDEDDFEEEEVEKLSNLSHTFDSKIDRSRKDNEQQCSLPAKMRKIDTSGSSNVEQGSSVDDAKSSTSEEPSLIRRKLLEEIDRLFPNTSSAPSTSSSAAPAASSPSAPSTSSAPTVPSTSSVSAEPSTSQGTGTRDRSNPQEPSACKSLWSMIARLERLLQQQREQRERLRNVLSDQGQGRRTNTWSLRDRNFERIENSGSDSDSNTDGERPRNWGGMSAEERLSNALQTERYERERMCRAAAGAQTGRGGQQEDEWEWTRESTRLRARQVLSLMVESLTQFFEENGLSSNTPHAVLDEQIFNLHVLLQLALELTDLLLAQLVCTRRELEHQWVHRLRNPVALAAEDQHSRDSDRERDTRSRGRQDDASGGVRLSPYRRLYRHRLSVDGDGNSRPERTSLRGSRTEYNRRLNSRVMNCLVSRHNRLPPHSGSAHNASMRPSRSTYGRPVTRPLMTRPSVPGHIPSHIMINPRVPVRRLEGDSGGNDANSGNDGNAERPPASSNEASSSSSSNIPTSQPHDAFTVPLVRVNDVLIPDTSLLNQPRTRPQSPPLLHPNSPFVNPFSQVGASEQRTRTTPWNYWPYVPGGSFRPRFLHPRYHGPNIFSDDSDDAAPGPDFSYFRANTVPHTVYNIPDETPIHRIQVWDFSKFQIPDISNAEKNVIVPECKIQNDASVDVSKDGRLLVTLLPTGHQSNTTMLGIYSLQWESLGQCLYTTSFLQCPVSVSLSPASRYLLVGFAARVVAHLPNDRHNNMAQVFRLDGGKPGFSVGGRGRLRHMRDIMQIRDQGYSLNCIKWAPCPGQGFVYGTNTGQLKVLQ